MLMVLGVVLLVLVIATWIYAVYLSWKKSEGTVFEPIERSVFVERWSQGLRLIRRGWYSVNLEGKHALSWGGKQAEHVIVSIFPKSAAVFAKHDELTGLHQGPSSYFLKSISGDKTPRPKRVPKTKKVV